MTLLSPSKTSGSSRVEDALDSAYPVRMKIGYSTVTACALFLISCGSTLPNQNPTGLYFPQVSGTSLTQEVKLIPDTFEGAPVVLLVGYTQRSQFDLDRWILGLIQADVKVRLAEIPTIEGLFPGMFANRIDSGMRRGIPEEDWGSVITVYDDASIVVAFLGNERPNNGRVLLLDADGKVRWLWDRGYSATAVLSLKAAAEALQPESAPQ